MKFMLLRRKNIKKRIIHYIFNEFNDFQKIKNVLHLHFFLSIQSFSIFFFVSVCPFCVNSQTTGRNRNEGKDK